MELRDALVVARIEVDVLRGVREILIVVIVLGTWSEEDHAAVVRHIWGSGRVTDEEGFVIAVSGLVAQLQFVDRRVSFNRDELMIDFVETLVDTHPYPTRCGKAASNIEDIGEHWFWKETFIELDESPFVTAGFWIDPLFEEVSFEIDVVLDHQIIAKGTVVMSVNVIGVDVS